MAKRILVLVLCLLALKYSF